MDLNEIYKIISSNMEYFSTDKEKLVFEKLLKNFVFTKDGKVAECLEEIEKIEIKYSENTEHQLTKFYSFFKLFTNLEYLIIKNNNISKIENLENCKNLKVLNLQYNDLLTIDNISELENLEMLDLEHNKINNDEKKIELNNGNNILKNLKIIKLNSNLLNHYDFIKDLPILEEVHINKNIIGELKPFVNCPKVHTLLLGGNALENIDNIINIPNLKILKVYSNNISSVSTKIKNVTLEDFSINDNHLTEIPKLNTSIRYLDVSNNKIERLYDMSDYDSLNTFILNNNSINNFKPLKNMKNVQFLDISKNIKNDNIILPVFDLPELREFYCNENKLSSLPDMSLCTGLTTIEFNKNDISDIRNLSKYQSVKNVSLQENKINFIPDLKECTQLYEIALCKNLLKRMYLAKFPKNVSTISFNNNPLKKIETIYRLENLTELYLRNTKINVLSNLERKNTEKTLYIYFEEEENKNFKYSKYDKDNFFSLSISFSLNTFNFSPNELKKVYLKTRDELLNKKHSMDKKIRDNKIKMIKVQSLENIENILENIPKKNTNIDNIEFNL